MRLKELGILVEREWWIDEQGATYMVDLALPVETLDRLLALRDELLRWNRKVNLTAVRDSVPVFIIVLWVI